MNPKLDHRILSLILTSLVVLGIPSCLCQNDDQYRTCSEPFQCGSLREIGYPFWGGNRPVSCGYPGFELTCQGDDNPLINIASIPYRVLSIDNSTQSLRVSRNDLWSTLCPRSFFNTTLNFTLFNFYSPANDQDITLYYGCTINQPWPAFLAPNYLINCSVFNPNSLNFFVTSGASGQAYGFMSTACNAEISVRVNQNAARELANPTFASIPRLQASLESGFSIQWSADNQNCSNCQRSGGLCGYNQTSTLFACHCTNGTFESTCYVRETGIGNETGNGNGTYEWLSFAMKILYAY